MDINKPYLTVPHPKTPIEIKEISEDEFNNIREQCNSIRSIGYYLRRLSVIELNKDAYFSIIAYYTSLLQKNDKSPIDYDYKEEGYIEINRCFINFISSFKALVEHCENKIMASFGEKSKQFISFNKILSSLYDSDINYRLLYNLRNFSVHKDFPIEYVDYDKIHAEKGEFRYEVGVFFSKEKFQSSQTLRSKMGEFMNKLEPKTKVYPFVYGLMPLVKEIVKEFIKFIKPEFSESMNMILKLSEDNKQNELSITRPEMVSGSQIDYKSIIIPIDIATNLKELTR